MTLVGTDTFNSEALESELIVVITPRDPVNVTKRRIDREIRRFGELEAVFDSLELEGPKGKRLMDERSRYFTVGAAKAVLDEIATTLLKHPDVHAAYVKPKGAEPLVAAAPAGASTTSNDFTQLQQLYLGPAPDGIGAIGAKGTPGTDGTNVRIIDCERNWNFNHEELKRKNGRVLVGTKSAKSHHGTAVLGIIAADDTNGVGIIGIAPAAEVNGAAFTKGVSTATTIDLAAKTLRAGDILLIEWDRSGPRGPHIPIEWWPDNLLAIQSAVANRIIVVAAAGNGSENLDHQKYNENPGMAFPPEWKNPFGQMNDSGAILVGAGAPPTGTHGPARSRIPDSNYGTRVDVQGWGANVTTTGGGDKRRLNSVDLNLWYTIGFNKTSAAAAMVAGIVASVQGARKKAGKTLWDSFAARAALRDLRYGSPQHNPAGGRIGHLPNLVELLKS
jgi:hypothetical protein